MTLTYIFHSGFVLETEKSILIFDYWLDLNSVVPPFLKKILTFLLAALGLTTACGQDNFENTDVQGFAELVADSNVVVLDVRTLEEFNDGHIKGAILIDQKQSDFIEKAKSSLPIDKKIAIYCRCGRRSANAAGRLADVGYKCVNLKGGIIAWKDAGKPVVTE